MKSKFLSFFCSAPAIIATLFISSCSPQKSQDSLPDPEDINNLPVSQILKYASQSYRIITPLNDGNDTSSLTLTASMQWPMSIADYDILPLQDELLSLAFDSKETKDVDQAIRVFITRPTEWIDTIADTKIEMTPVPIESFHDYAISVTSNVTELTMRTVTYFVTTSTYLGGAHPNSNITPMTFNFDTNRVITSEDLFLPGSDMALEKMIAEELSIEYNVSADNLMEAGFFNNRIVPTSMVYLQDNMIVFHYNPYEIAPYSFGMIDVALSPYQVKDLLTPYYSKFFSVDQ